MKKSKNKCIFILLTATFFITTFASAQWEVIATPESNQFGTSSGWVGSDNGSPYDCSNLSIQKNPVIGDFVYVPQYLEVGFLYRFTYYVKARQPQVFCELLEGLDNSAGGNSLDYAYNQQGSADYSYTAGDIEIAVSPAMVCGDTFKYTSSAVAGDGELHYFKLLVKDVQGIAFTKPLRVAHCIIEKRLDNSYLFPLNPSDLLFNSIEDKRIEISWTDNSTDESGFIVERSFNGGGFIKHDTLSPNTTSFVDHLVELGEYSYRVFAFNGEGNSDATNTVTTVIYDTPPLSPSDFQSDIIDSRHVSFSWSDNSNNEYGFKIESGLSDSWEPAPGSPVGEDTESLVVGDLSPSSNYSFRIFAWNNMGSSDTISINLMTPDPSNDGIVFPEDAGILNVKDFGAKGDGTTDDTESIQSAMNVGAGKFVYFPVGTYLVSDRLEWPGDARTAPMILIGQKMEETIIRLSDNNPKYQNSIIPNAVIWTQEMGSADNFRNFIKNLTVNTGSGNPAAIGIQYMSNNMGTVSDVCITSEDGSGEIGLDLAYNNLNGPLLISKVKIDGFNYGIKSSGAVNSLTFEHITLQNQKIIGFQNSGQVVSIRGIISNNTVTAVYNKTGEGVITLLDSELKGGASEYPAIINQGALFARNIKTQGYQKAIDNLSGTGVDFDEEIVEEFVSHEVASQFAWTKPKSLNLEILETPDIQWQSDLSEWANVQTFGAIPDDSNDDSQAIKDAIASGKSVIYFPKGTYNVSGSIEISAKVEQIVGLESMITVGTQSGAVFVLPDSPTSPSIVEIQHLSVTPTNTTPAVNNQSAARTLVVRYCKGFGGIHTGTGNVFYEDVGTGVNKPMAFTGGTGQKVWIRQLSNEPRDGVTHILNDGATFWILGHKTEQPGTLIETKNGGKTEVCGGFAYSVGGDNSIYPMYINDNSSMSATMGGAFFTTKYETYQVLVEETHSSVTKNMNASEFPHRAGFKMIPLYVGYPDDGTGSVPDAPDNLSTEETGIGQFRLTWQDHSSNEDGFGVEMSIDNGDFEAIDSTNSNTTIISLSDLEVQKKYCFRVFAFNELGNSSYSNEVCDTLKLLDGIGPISINDGSVSFFPNPFSDNLNIHIELSYPAEVGIQIFDLSGRKIKVFERSEMNIGIHIISWDGHSDAGTSTEQGIFNAQIMIKFNDNNTVQRNIKIIKLR
jgi:hypothetical protein